MTGSFSKALHSVVRVLSASARHSSDDSGELDVASKKLSMSSRFSGAASQPGVLLRSLTTGSSHHGKHKATFDYTVHSRCKQDKIALSRDWPTDAAAYELLEDAGRGTTATVHRAICKPFGDLVAVKVMDLENLGCKLEDIIKEAQLLKQYHHPNVLPLYCSFLSGDNLWLVMPFIGNGSLQTIMHQIAPEGLDEVVVATIMRDVFRALDYVHHNGAIHRDIKAGNILISSEGRVLLADFGVSAQVERSANWDSKASRNTFVGTPCWMAPEVMEQLEGYDSSADIWSCGITLFELATGSAPYAHYSPMKIVMLTLQKPPPTLEDTSKRTYSKALKEVIAMCLQKDPKLRPSAAHVLEHKFFKLAMDEAHLAKHLVSRLSAKTTALITSGHSDPASPLHLQ